MPRLFISHSPLAVGPQGQAEEEGGARPLPALDPNPATVKLHNVLHNGEAKPGAAFLAGTTLVDTVEALEKMRYILGRNAGTVVTQGNDDLTQPLKPGGKMDARTLGRVFEGVIEKIFDDLGKLERVNEESAVGRIHRQLQHVVSGGGPAMIVVDDRGQEGLKVD